MRVYVEIPDATWWRAARNAEDEGTTIADVLHTAVLNLAGAETVRQQRDRGRRAAVITLAQQGLTIGEIAAQTHETRLYVQRVRRAAGIPTNRTTSGTSRTKERKVS